MKKNILKTIAITLLILITIITPISSYVEFNKAYASITLTAAALTILKYVIPIIASYICINTIGKSYTNSDLQRFITQLNKSQEAIWQFLGAYGKLTLYKVINNIKNIGKSIAECASELLITDSTVIESASTYSDNLTTKVQNNENLVAKDIIDLGIADALSYSVAKIATDTNFINANSVDTNNSVSLGDCTISFEKTIPSKDFLSSITDTVGYLEANVKMNFSHEDILLQDYYYYFTNGGYKYLMHIICRRNIIAINNNVNVNFNRWNDCLVNIIAPDYTMIIDIYYFNTASMTYESATVASLRIGDILGEVGLSTFKTKLANGVENYDKSSGGRIYEKIQASLNTLDTTNMTLWDILNVSLYGEFTINPALDRPISIDIPLYPTGSICNDDIWDFVDPQVDRQTVTVDTNVTINPDGTIGVNTQNPTLDGIPITDWTDTSIPDVDNPGGTGAGTDTPNGILEWLKAFWEWLKTVLTFEWLKALINTIIEAIKSLPDAFRDNIDWGKFKGFFDIFIILIYLIIIACKIFIKLIGVALNLLNIQASDAFFQSYPTILSGINYIKNINVPVINVTLYQLIFYMFSFFFFIYILKMIQTIYHVFTRQEDSQLRETQREIKEHNKNLDTNRQVRTSLKKSLGNSNDNDI